MTTYTRLNLLKRFTLTISDTIDAAFSALPAKARLTTTFCLFRLFTCAKSAPISFFFLYTLPA